MMNVVWLNFMVEVHLGEVVGCQFERNSEFEADFGRMVGCLVEISWSEHNMGMY